MKKTKLGRELYETALWKVTSGVDYAIGINCWHVAREANYEGRGVAYALWNTNQISEEELDKLVEIFWENHNKIEKHFAGIKE